MPIRQLRITKQITKRESQCLDMYLHEIADFSPLTPEQEVECAKKIKNGKKLEREQALAKLVNCNLRFVVSVCKQYQNQGLSLTELIAAGNLGLIAAAPRFDHTRGFKFISYAVWWTRQAIIKEISECSRDVRVPLNCTSVLNKILKMRSALEQTYQRPPTNAEIAEKLSLNPEEVKRILEVCNRNQSIDTPFVAGEEGTLLDVLADSSEKGTEDETMEDSLKQELSKLVAELDTRQADIIRSCFGIDGYPKMTLQEIGDKVGLTRERMRQVREQALTALRKKAVHTNLRSYL